MIWQANDNTVFFRLSAASGKPVNKMKMDFLTALGVPIGYDGTVICLYDSSLKG